MFMMILSYTWRHYLHSSIDIKVNAYTKTNVYKEFLKIREQVILEAVRQFRAEGIDFAFPSTTVYMAKDEN